MTTIDMTNIIDSIQRSAKLEELDDLLNELSAIFKGRVDGKTFYKSVVAKVINERIKKLKGDN